MTRTPHRGGDGRGSSGDMAPVLQIPAVVQQSVARGGVGSTLGVSDSTWASDPWVSNPGYDSFSGPGDPPASRGQVARLEGLLVALWADVKRLNETNAMETRAFKCRLDGACLGGWDFEVNASGPGSSCAEGHFGVRCAKCQIQLLESLQ